MSVGEEPRSYWATLLGTTGACPSCKCGRDGQRRDEDVDDAASHVKYISTESLKRSVSISGRSISRNALEPSLESVKAVKFASQTSIASGASPGTRKSHSPFSSGSPLHLNGLWLLSNLHQRMSSWHKSVVTSLSPLDVENERGVRLQNTYDYYDAESRKLEVRQMTGGADGEVHIRDEAVLRRASLAGPRVDLSGELAAGPTPDGKRGGARRSLHRGLPSGGSSQSKKEEEPRGGDRDLRREESQRRQQQAEVVTLWGVLVGKVIHTQVLDFRAMTVQVISNRKLQTMEKHRRVARTVADRAELVVKQARNLMEGVALESDDAFDGEWHMPDLMANLFSEEYVDTLLLIANAARKLVAAQPVLAEASAPCRIFGDIHGQLRDLLLLFHAYGFPSKYSGPDFIFNGDFVDRGKHQVEVVGLLFALKVTCPDKVWLIRGNHEDRAMSNRYGFKSACDEGMGEFGSMVFESIHKCFDQLPVACRVGQKILIMHGGIGEGRWTLDDVRSLQRPMGLGQMKDPSNSWVFNILWSDPIEDDAEGAQGVFGVHESPRAIQAKQFAWNVTKTFCARNGLGLIVRSHQSKRGSLGFDVMHDNLLMRVFSARDYEHHGNDGAVLLVSHHDSRQMLQVRPQVLRSLTKSRAAQQDVRITVG